MISICITIKNRSRVRVQARELRLFPNCVSSIVLARPRNLEAELVVSDWASDDWPLNDWLRETAGELPVTIVPIDGAFSRGRGRNIAAQSAHGDTLLFLDADTLISEAVITHGKEQVEAGRAYFPVLYSYDDPEHATGYWRPSSLGNCMISRRHFEMSGGWPDYAKWGKEDDDFHARISALTEVVREQVPGFYHQWHPEDLLWKDRFVARDPGEVEEIRRVAETCSELEAHLPYDATFVLLDEDRFGTYQKVLARARPFLELNGVYAGPPPDGHHAVREMERMLQEGTRYVAITWIAGWWMEHYHELGKYLASRGRLIVHNDRLQLYEMSLSPITRDN